MTDAFRGPNPGPAAESLWRLAKNGDQLRAELWNLGETGASLMIYKNDEIFATRLFEGRLEALAFSTRICRDYLGDGWRDA